MNEKRLAARIPWIDALKGFAILAVVIGHCLDGYLNAGTFPNEPPLFRLLYEVIYAYHMPLFFLISGYTFFLAYVKGGELNRRKFATQLSNLVLLYVVWALLLWISKRMFAEFVNTTYGVRNLLEMFLSPLGNYWYIYVLALVYIVMVAVRMWKWNTTLLVAGTVAIMVAARVCSGVIHPTFYRLCYFLFFFCVGVAFCRKPELAHRKTLFALCVILTAAFWYLSKLEGLPRAVTLIVTPGLALTMSYLFVFVAAAIKWKENGFLQLCGTYCLHIYLIHPYFTAGNRTLLPLLGITQPYVALAVNTLSSLLVSLGIAMVCDRLPWTMILFRPVAFIQKYIVRR